MNKKREFVNYSKEIKYKRVEVAGSGGVVSNDPTMKLHRAHTVAKLGATVDRSSRKKMKTEN